MLILSDMYSPQFCLLRHILACLHFNENVHRETKRGKSGNKLLKVTYPKYKAGDELVREVAVPATYGMFTDWYIGKFILLLFTHWPAH